MSRLARRNARDTQAPTSWTQLPVSQSPTENDVGMKGLSVKTSLLQINVEKLCPFGGFY